MPRWNWPPKHASAKIKGIETMSIIKKVFPLACFNVMTHLVIHLVEEFELCSDVPPKVHESSKRLRKKHGTTIREHGNRVYN